MENIECLQDLDLICEDMELRKTCLSPKDNPCSILKEKEVNSYLLDNSKDNKEACLKCIWHRKK